MVIEPGYGSGELPLAFDIEGTFEGIFAFLDLGAENVLQGSGGFVGAGSSQSDLIIAAIVVIPSTLVREKENKVEVRIAGIEMDNDAGFTVLFREWGLDRGLARRRTARWPKGLRWQPPLIFGVVPDVPVEQATFVGGSFDGYFHRIVSAASFDG